MKRRLILSLTLGMLLLPATSSAYSPMRGRLHHTHRTSSSVRAFDTTATIIGASWFTKAYQQGFRLYVLHSTAWGSCDAWYRTQPQLKLALAAGLKVAAYTRDPRCWRQGIEATGPYAAQLQFFAFDVETDPGVAITQEMVDGISSMGIRPVIYTGSGMWPGIMSATTAFAGVALWDTDTTTALALRTWIPSLYSPTPVLYGGWNTPLTMRKGVQQAFEVQLNGVAVDLSSFDASFLR